MQHIAIELYLHMHCLVPQNSVLVLDLRFPIRNTAQRNVELQLLNLLNVDVARGAHAE